MANETNKESFWSPRFVLALIVSSVVLLVVLVFGILSIALADNAGNTAKDVFTFTLPVLGTWVATVLAYYFSKENLDAAAKNMKDILSISLHDKLRSIPVKDKMIAKDKIFHGSLPTDEIKFSDVLKQIESGRKGVRYPVFDENNKTVKFIIHKSMITDYLADLALRVPPQSDLQNKTLKDLLDDPDDNKKYGEFIRTSFGAVDESATLMDAKVTMEAIPNCQDVFVTKGGKRSDEVVGWITNAIIIENSKV